MKRLLVVLGAAAVVLAAPLASATFHTFRIEELFSTADGSVQFVVLHESEGANGQEFWAGHALTASGGGATRSFTFPTNLPDDRTAGRRVLVASEGFKALGIIAPDFVVPNGFLPLTGGTVNFAGVDAVSYAALPVDGSTALSAAGTPIAAVATNFDGASVTVKVSVAVPPASNYQGLWYAAPAESESGWGLNVAHQGDVIFATWFTYDGTGKAWWLSMTANRQPDGSFAGTLYQTTGPAFSAVPFDPSQVVATPVGSATLRFGDSDGGTFAYTVNGVTQSKAITRQKFGVVPTCTWNGLADLSQATNYQDLWWASPPQSESGWGINLTHQGSVIFATWFTYDTDGSPMWLSVTAAQTAPATFTGTLIRTAGPAFNAVPFDPAKVTRADVGTATFTFANGNAATFAYTVDGISQSKAIVRQVFRPPGTACR